MTRDEIIELALQCGIWVPMGSGPEREQTIDRLCRFATFIAEAEREACAKGIEDSTDGMEAIGGWSEGYLQAAKDIAEGIRARGKS